MGDSAPDLKLTQNQREALLAIAQGTPETCANRARIILGWDQLNSHQEIAANLGLSIKTVQHWLTAFVSSGLDIFPDTVLDSQQKVPESVTTASMCRRYRIEMVHARHVAELCAGLLDVTNELHNLPPDYHRTAYLAGLLHNIAYAGGRAKHHKRGRNILLETPIMDISNRDRALLAVTTLLHRKSWSMESIAKDRSFRALTADDQHTALVLSALLRIADGLDYSHSQTTHLVRGEYRNTGLYIALRGPFAEYDIGRASEKSDLWQWLFKTPIVFTISQPAGENEGSDPQAEEVTIISPVPPQPQAPNIYKDDLMSEAGRKILQFHFARMCYNEPETRKGIDIEALHDMRVAVRRMRSAMRIFEAYYKEKTSKRMMKGLQRTGQILGRVRDLDVFMENAQKYITGLPIEQKSDLDMMISLWQKHRDQARKAMLEYLDSPAYRNFVKKMERFTGTPGKGVRSGQQASTRVCDAVPVIIADQFAAVTGYDDIIHESDIPTLHALRIDVKRLRYTLEFFKDVLEPEAGKVVRVFVAVQDHLGMLNDADTARETLRKFIKKLFKNTFKEQENPDVPAHLPGYAGMQAYLGYCENVMTQQQETLPEVWEGILSRELYNQMEACIDALKQC